jgi:formamidopyrimidine-DNA glycosylase
MPELPEVEHAARCLRAWALGRRILAAELDPRARRLYRPGSGPAFARAVTGRKVESVGRLGKHLLLTLGDGAPLGLLLHLGMTGKWVRRLPGEPPPSHSRLRLALEGGALLHYRDPRLFGRLRLVPGARFDEHPELRALGPDPLAAGVDAGRLAARLARTRRPVKVALLDQRILPGVGNIHAAEACFRARLDPRRPASGLSRPEVARLARGVRASFRAALSALGDGPGPEIAYVEEGGENPFLVYAREGERCPRCRLGRIGRIVQAQRSTFFCPACQRPGGAPRSAASSWRSRSGSSGSRGSSAAARKSSARASASRPARSSTAPRSRRSTASSGASRSAASSSSAAPARSPRSASSSPAKRRGAGAPGSMAMARR